MKERQLQTITAESGVTMDYNGVRATGDRAIYRSDTGLANITGNPRWMTEQREGSTSIIDATNQISTPMARRGSTGQTFGAFRSSTEAAPAPLAIIMWRFFRTTTIRHQLGRKTSALWNGSQPGQKHDELRELTAWYSGTNRLQSLIAERACSSSNKRNNCRAAKRFTSTSGLLELTDQPSWRSGTREGRGERMLIVVGERAERLRQRT
jgi:hypothetical protein